MTMTTSNWNHKKPNRKELRYTPIHMYMRTNTYICTHVHTYQHTHTYIRPKLHTYTQPKLYIQYKTHMCTNTCICIHVHTYTHTHTHTHTPPHTLAIYLQSLKVDGVDVGQPKPKRNDQQQRLPVTSPFCLARWWVFLPCLIRQRIIDKAWKRLFANHPTIPIHCSSRGRFFGLAFAAQFTWEKKKKKCPNPLH